MTIYCFLGRSLDLLDPVHLPIPAASLWYSICRDGTEKMAAALNV